MKSIFPAIYSTLSPLALVNFITERYSLDSFHCTFLVQGVGDTYLVDSAQRRFILRIYRSTHRSLSHVKAEVALPGERWILIWIPPFSSRWNG